MRTLLGLFRTTLLCSLVTLLLVPGCCGFSPSLLAHVGNTLIMHKPAGMATSLRADTRCESLIEQVRLSFPDAELPHRIDRVTAGLVVVAANKDDLRFHNDAIAAREWRKLYLARLLGSVADIDDKKLLGTHKAYIKEGKGNMRAASIVRSGGKPSSLEVVHVARGPEKGTLDAVIELHTGRYHQIRVMMANLGVPLAGTRPSVVKS